MTSSPKPEPANRLRRAVRSAGEFARVAPPARRDLLRAAVELALARFKLIRAHPETWLAAGPGRQDADDAVPRIDRVAYAIPRAAARVPWRATCLVQALAAKRWLARMGVDSQLRLGARASAGDGLDAHAWLEAGGRIVVGGDSGDYVPFSPGGAA